jgi:hypothetical protein
VRITTFFPLELPRLPGIGRAMKTVCGGSVGKPVGVFVGARQTVGTVVSIVRVEGGVATTIDIDDGILG